MTSLCPGALFKTSGLNHHFTPTPTTATPSEIDHKLQRQPFNGHGWPRDSPVARVYDVTNTSTSLVLLNRRKKKMSQLRGLTDLNGEIMTPEPYRHLTEEPTVNEAHHKQCLLSCSEPFKPQTNHLAWVNASQRPPVRFDNGSHVNRHRHTTCRVSGEGTVERWMWGLPPHHRHHYHHRPATTSTCGVDSELRSMSPILNDPEIPEGGRRYLYSIARIYSTSQMKQLKQDQYQKLLLKELSKGYHSRREYKRYLRYLNTPRKTQQGKLDNYEEQRRARSVPPPACSNDTGRKHKRTTMSSRSWGPSIASSGSRPSTREKRKTQPHSPKPTDKDSTDTLRNHSQESDTDDDPTDHTHREETEHRDKQLTAEGSESSQRSKTKMDSRTTSSMITKKETESARLPKSRTKEPPPAKEQDGVSPKKGDEGTMPRKNVLSPRKREETVTPKKDVERSSEKGGGTASHVAPSNSGTTGNTSFLSIIVNDPEKVEDRTDEGSEKQSSADDRAAATTNEPSQPASLTRNLSDEGLAPGYTPRVNQEGRTRPLSRAGKPTEWRGAERRQKKESFDDDYNNTDDEREEKTTSKEGKSSPPPAQQQKKEEEEAWKWTNVHSDPQTVDTSRTDESKGQEQGGMVVETMEVKEPNPRAGSPDERIDEQARPSQAMDGPRSVVIPVNQQPEARTAVQSGHMDLSGEGRNRDVDKLEY